MTAKNEPLGAIYLAATSLIIFLASVAKIGSENRRNISQHEYSANATNIEIQSASPQNSLDALVDGVAEKITNSPASERTAETPSIEKYSFSYDGNLFNMMFVKRKPSGWNFNGKIPGTTNEVFILDMIGKPGIETYDERGNSNCSETGEHAFATNNRAAYTSSIKVLEWVNSRLINTTNTSAN